MAVGDVYRTTIIGLLHGQLIETVLHWQETTSGAGNAQATLALLVGSAFASGPLSRLSQEFAYQKTLAQKFYPTPVLFPAVSTFGADTGSVTEPSLPTSSAVTIKKQTALSGPRYRGRVYQAGIPLTHVSNSVMDPTPLTALLSAWGTVITPVTSGGFVWRPVLWSGGFHTVTEIGQLDSDGRIRVRRRREVGVGV